MKYATHAWGNSIHSALLDRMKSKVFVSLAPLLLLIEFCLLYLAALLLLFLSSIAIFMRTALQNLQIACLHLSRVLAAHNYLYSFSILFSLTSLWKSWPVLRFFHHFHLLTLEQPSHISIFPFLYIARFQERNILKHFSIQPRFFAFTLHLYLGAVLGGAFHVSFVCPLRGLLYYKKKKKYICTQVWKQATRFRERGRARDCVKSNFVFA